ncbi:MAG: UDP-N-acetylmuramoyl-L-alanine--D-glutamate ligase [Spirochaetaceae bacterium]|nr:UDP-N-acetylmuramoyl-L-alanine--D-glutamate ligase [Spirochaetaceae bacterium]
MLDGRRYHGARALIMGLGIHGGGLGAARFLARYGARLTVTDLRGEDALRPSIDALDWFVKSVNGCPVKYTLGRHDIKDFEEADIVIKNPGVRPDSPFLKAANLVETDISLFLKHSPARLTAVTGSKGKSFTASAIHFGLREAGRAAFLGGNITVSPLNFLEELTPDCDVVLELSSWQLGDLPPGLLKPRVAVMTAIMPDHLDRYGSMEKYVADKRIIYQAQDEDDALIACDDDWGRGFLSEKKGKTYLYGCEKPADGIAGAFFGKFDKFDKEGGFDGIDNIAGFAAGPIAGLRSGESECIVPADVTAPGLHQKMNLTAAGLALLELGIPVPLIRDCMRRFPGIEHRLEFFYEKNGARFYNDTAATIPEAAAAAVRALGNPVIVTGGTDKNLNFSPLADALLDARAVVLLAGTGSAKLAALLEARNKPFSGPWNKLEDAVKAAVSAAVPGCAVVLSPGCASFEMFLNEFDRGRKWKAAVIKVCDALT